MLIPHEQGKSVHFRVSISILVLTAVLLGIMVFGGVFTALRYTEAQQAVTHEQEIFVESDTQLALILDEVEGLISSYDIFDASLQSTVDDLDITVPESLNPSGTGDLTSVSGLREVTRDEVAQLYNLRELRNSLTQALQPVSEIGRVLSQERSLLADLPTLWPVVGGKSSLSMEYGPNIHPYWDEWQLQPGITIPGSIGSPVISSANGTVVEAHFDPLGQKGNTVEIVHKYGFRTRYSHLGSLLVREGQEVYQGQQLGIIGRTGMSVGTYLEFQVMLGTEILDPMDFLKIRSDYPNWASN